MAGENQKWFVYILRCRNNSLYTGVTTDVTRRFSEHRGEKKGKGARFTRANMPVSIVYTEESLTRSEAQIREAEIKKLKKVEKERLITTNTSISRQTPKSVLSQGNPV